MSASLNIEKMLDPEANNKVITETLDDIKKRNIGLRRSGTESILRKFVAWYLVHGYDDLESAISRYVEEEIR